MNVLGSYPGDVTLTLYPMAKEILNNINDIPVSRRKLNEFIADIKVKNPKINFDTSILDNFSESWFLDILTDPSLRADLKRDTLEEVYDAILQKYK